MVWSGRLLREIILGIWNRCVSIIPLDWDQFKIDGLRLYCWYFSAGNGWRLRRWLSRVNWVIHRLLLPWGSYRMVWLSLYLTDWGYPLQGLVRTFSFLLFWFLFLSLFLNFTVCVYRSFYESYRWSFSKLCFHSFFWLRLKVVS